MHFFAAHKPLEGLFNVSNFKGEITSEGNTLTQVIIQSRHLPPKIEYTTKLPLYSAYKFSEYKDGKIIVIKDPKTARAAATKSFLPNSAEGIWFNYSRDSFWCIYSINTADLQGGHLLKSDIPNKLLSPHFDKYVVIK